MSDRDIQAKLEPLLGQKAWGVSLGVGSFLTLEFGQPLPLKHDTDRVHGEWHLWLYGCAWRLEENGKLLAASEDDRQHLESAIRRLERLPLTTVDVLPPWDTVFTFDRQVVLRTFALHSEGYEHWMLYTPDGNVLNVGPGEDWSYERSEAIPA